MSVQPCNETSLSGSCSHSCFHPSLPAMDGPVVASRQRMADAETTLLSDECAAATSHKKYREQQCEQTAAKKEQGNQAFKNGDMSAAIEAYSEAIEMDFSAGDDDKATATLYANRAAAYMRVADSGQDVEFRRRAWTLAGQDCHRSLQRDPHAVKVLLRCALACEKLGNLEMAFECVARALLEQPINSAARDAATRLRNDYEQLSCEVDVSDASKSTAQGSYSTLQPQLQPLTASARTAKYIRQRRDNRVERGQEKMAQAYAEVMALLSIPEVKASESTSQELAKLDHDRLEYYSRIRKMQDTDVVYYGELSELPKESELAREQQREIAEERVKELRAKLGIKQSTLPGVSR